MLAVLLQLAPPALQVTGMHFQRARHFDHALPTVQSAYRRLLEIFGEFSARLHVPVSPFNDFQRLTGCLKNGVHSRIGDHAGGHFLRWSSAAPAVAVSPTLLHYRRAS